MPPTALALRLARRLHAARAGRAPPPEPGPAGRALDVALDRVARARRRLRQAADRGLSLAAARLAAELAAGLDDLARHAARLRAACVPEAGPAPGPSDWFREVRQLEAEFGGVEVRWGERSIRARTDPIALRGVPLGPFAIDFFWDRAGVEGGAHCFGVEALDPNPAAGRDEVVHPHVRGGDLCAGDAAAPLARAVAGGRLADAFLLVRSVLATYNPASPFVPLSEWSGLPCADCGRRVDPDDRYACAACDADLCGPCSGACAACGASRCDNCLEPCDACRASCCGGCLERTGTGREVCPDCLGTCPRCAARAPRGELTAGAMLCPACDQEEDEADDDVGPPGAAGVPADA